jgi:hypothetical protein
MRALKAKRPPFRHAVERVRDAHAIGGIMANTQLNQHVLRREGDVRQFMEGPHDVGRITLSLRP